MAISIQQVGTRIYFQGHTFPVKDRIKAMGGHWDGDRKEWWVGTAKADEARKLAESLTGAATNNPAERTAQNPRDIRLTGKGEYKGRTYYLGSRTRDGMKIRCLTLPGNDGKFLDFWASVEMVRVVKTYQVREYRGREEYTTLGSIASFIAKSRREDDQIKAGNIPDGYCVDLEDGQVKRRSECDIPSD